MNFNSAPENYNDEDLLAAWITCWTGTDDATTCWATDELCYDLAQEQPERAWSLITELMRRAPDDAFLSVVAAGPLENLLCQHGPTFIVRVEEQARADPRFRHGLAGVWGWNRMDPEVYRRMRAAVGDESL